MAENFYQKKWFWAILSILVVECFALYQGIDGLLLGGVVAGLAGLGGYELGKKETV